MTKITLPLDLLSRRDVSFSSPKAQEAREKAREAAGPPLQAAERLRTRMDSWNGRVAKYDDGPSDFAANEKGLVVLHRHFVPTGSRRGAQKITAELKETADGRVSTSKIEVSTAKDFAGHFSFPSYFSYKRLGEHEFYEENSGDKTFKLLLDHAKGTLTYEVHDSGKLVQQAWPFPT